MRLTHVTGEYCPVCNVPTRSTSRVPPLDGKGHSHEIRAYQCGMRIDYLPGEGKKRIVAVCPKDLDWKFEDDRSDFVLGQIQYHAAVRHAQQFGYYNGG